MTIHKIQKLKNGKYKIILENENIITYDNVIIENNLLYKKTLDICLYEKIIKDTQYYDVYNKIVKLILKKRRSEKEIKTKLLEYEFTPTQKEQIINKLKNINLINDLEYCKAYINDKIYLSKVGINNIKKDLLNQEIDITLIEEQLKKIDYNIFNNRLEKMIIKKINTNKKYSNLFLKNKILNEMINMGYEKKDILNIIENNLKDDKEIIEKEFAKEYTKLNKKYTGKELLNKVQQKLIIKGFSIYKIKELIQEKTEE